MEATNTFPAQKGVSSRNLWEEQMDRGHSPKTMGRQTPKHPGLSPQEAWGWERAQKGTWGEWQGQVVCPDGFLLSHQGAKGAPLLTEDSPGRSPLFSPVVHAPQKGSDPQFRLLEGGRKPLFSPILKQECHFWYRQASAFQKQVKLNPLARGTRGKAII